MSELRPHGRELLEAARLERTPSARDRDRVFQALLASAAAATVTTAAASTAAAPSLLAKLACGAAKWWLLGGLCSAIAGGSYLVTRPAATEPVATVAPQAPPQAQTPLPSPAPAVEPAPAMLPTAPRPQGDARPAPLKREPAASTQPAASTLERELSGLHAAHAAYRGGQPDQALALVAEHRKRFPKSQLGVERSTLEVLSLCQLGRQSQAQALADKLRASARGAAALSGLEGSCAAPPRK